MSKSKILNLKKENKFELLAKIPLTSENILEIGCGSGSLGYEFKRRQPLAKYFGLETEEEFEPISQKWLDLVFKANTRNYINLEGKIPLIDCLIYRNILESYQNPLKLLKDFTPLLKEKGIIILSISNIQYWKSIQELLTNSVQGQKENDQIGFQSKLLNLNNIKNIIEELGFNICEIKPVISNINEVINFVDKMDPILNKLEINKNQFIKNVAPSQFIIVAQKGGRRKMHIDVLKSKVNPPVIADSRINVPFNALNTIPEISTCIGEEIKLLPENSILPRIIILNRALFKKDEISINRIKKLLNNGYLIIIDIDDDPSDFIKKDTNNSFTFRSCHAIQVSTPLIAKKLIHLNDEIKVFPNVIERIGDIKNNLNKDSKITIFFGALNRQNDWKPWINSLNKALSNNKNRWKFKIVHDEAFYNSIELPKEQIEFTSLCSYQKYLEIMNTSDICFMPLLNTNFNQCKSDLKAIEAASLSLAILSTPVVYNQTFIDGETAKFFNDEEALIKILHNWEKNPNKIRELGFKARSYVLENRLASQNILNRLTWYKDLLKRKNQLTKKLLEREPELKK